MTIHQALNSLIPPNAWGSSLILVIADNKKQELHQFGTGTLLKVADDSFIVTAAHVVIDANEYNMGLCVATGNSFTPLDGKWCYPSKRIIDIAILRLSQDLASKLDQASYVRLQDVEFNTDLSKGVFCLLGYPARLSNSSSTASNPIMNIKPFQYITTAYEGETRLLDEYDEKYHFLLMAEDGGTDSSGKVAKFSDPNGILLQFPKQIGGISGCSVWKLGNHDKPVSDWHSRPKIVAVQTAVYSETQLIKTTRWAAVYSLLYEAYPDLRPALGLWHVEY